MVISKVGEKKSSQEYKNPYSKMLLESKNIIFRGAPGTGKSYLSKQIAADIISNGFTDRYSDLTDEQKRQMEFVQFHPSYDYSDFVEGIRPKMDLSYRRVYSNALLIKQEKILKIPKSRKKK